MDVNLPQGDNYQLVIPKGNYIVKKKDSGLVAVLFSSSGASTRIAMLLLYFILFTWWLWKNAVIDNGALIGINYIFDDLLWSYIGIITMLVIAGLSVLFNFWSYAEMRERGETIGSSQDEERQMIKGFNAPFWMPIIVSLLEAVGFALIWIYLFLSVGNGIESDTMALQIIFWSNVAIIAISFLFSIYQYIILRKKNEGSVYTGWFLFSAIILHVAMVLVVWLFMPALFTAIF